MSNDNTILLNQYIDWLIAEEKASATVEKYKKDISDFLEWIEEHQLTKQKVVEWKEQMVVSKLSPVTVNTKIAAINSFLQYIGRYEFRIRPLKIQRKIFRGEERDLSKKEYLSLISAANRLGKYQLALVMETICSTGIRVSELKYITVEAAYRGQVNINMKGKVRSILLPSELRRKLKKYAGKKKIASGEIFLSRSGKSLCRKLIWANMKKICRAAGVEESKVFPHNLRHLFAVSYYRICRDVAKLADVLGHSSIETTKIYLVSTGAEHVKVLNEMKLVV